MGVVDHKNPDPVLNDFAYEVGPTQPIAIAGNRTCWELSGTLNSGTTVISAPSGIVDYRPEEMIVTVRAGTTIKDLDECLAVHKQRTSLPDRGGTVGGAIAVGHNDLQRLGKGSVRDAVLRLRYISSEGQIITCGGPVVKNVTGFNLHKLMVGSFGTLGLIAEATLRTNPIPPAQSWVKTMIDPKLVFDKLLRPSAILWDGQTTWVHLEGHLPDITAQKKTLGKFGTLDEVAHGPELPANRWSLPPADLYQLDTSDIGNFVASIGVGTVWADLPQKKGPPDKGKLIIENRLKQQFDPENRLSPGRKVGNWS